MTAPTKSRYERFYLILNITAPSILAGTLLRFPPLAAIVDARMPMGAVPASEAFAAVLLIIGFVGSLYLLFTKNKDELIRHYWQRAATFTFAVLLLSPLFLGVAISWYAIETLGTEALKQTEEMPDLVSADLFQTLMILSFFLSFYWYKRQGEAA